MASINKDGSRPNPPQKDQFKSFFFTGLRVLITIIMVMGVLGVIYILRKDEPGAIYKAVGMSIALLWACVFLSYFVWALYYYNINLGKTDFDWETIYQTKEKNKMLHPDEHEHVDEPSRNPNHEETFGLPAGTVRGMIAFTLLFGAISMLIISMGMNSELDRNSFFWDHFEFFKTAFLMMIAFYFGSRSLEILQKGMGKGVPPSQPLDNTAATVSKTIPTQYAQVNGSPGPIAAGYNEETEVLTQPTPTGLRNMLQSAHAEAAVQPGTRTPAGPKTGLSRSLEHEYVQIKDNSIEKFLSVYQIKEVAEENNLEYAAVKAVIDVESSGKGFLANGKPKILFEGHKFWYHLQNTFGIDPNTKLAGNENILYKTWTKKYYLGGAKEYDRFDKAKMIHEEAAIYATSWGLFQVMGENIHPSFKNVRRHGEVVKNDHKTLVGKFYDAQCRSELEHLLDFMDFIKYKKFNKKPLIEYLQAPTKDWSSFAHGYNGSGYEQNAYHIKLQRAYEQYNS